MEVVASRDRFRKTTSSARAGGARIGLVPTMGALHEGHLSLVRAAVSTCDVVAVTIFVNPLQFASADDLATYPSSLEEDLAKAETAGAELVFVPPASEMYPRGAPRTLVSPGPLADRLEGAARPGHFAGVATVVTKLLSLAGSCRAFFGEKDFQQLAIVRNLVEDLDLDAEIVSCPTVREPDGLACSSRNRRLDQDGRGAAAVLYEALAAGKAAIDAGERDRATVERNMSDIVATERRAQLGYAVAVDPVTFDSPALLAGEVRLLIAVEIGPVRLIDNLAAGR